MKAVFVPNEVEESLTILGLEASRDVSTPLDMTLRGK
jgi:hypothetical protein